MIGKHPRGANDAEIEKLLDSMEQMVEDAVAPPGRAAHSGDNL